MRPLAEAQYYLPFCCSTAALSQQLIECHAKKTCLKYRLLTDALVSCFSMLMYGIFSLSWGGLLLIKVRGLRILFSNF